MAQAAGYPGNNDINNYMIAAGLPTVTLDTAVFLNAAIADFEKRARRVMYAPAADATRTYDPPINDSGYLDLVQDLSSLTGVVYFPQGAVSGETWTLNIDHWLRPYNAAADSKPYLGLELKRRFMSPLLPAMHRSIQVTGKWGYVANGQLLPSDVWEAMLARAVVLMGPSIAYKLSAGVVRTADTGVERLYSDWPGKGMWAMWEASFEDAVKRYQRWAL